MSWVKLDDQFTDHPKVVKAGPMASWLFVCGLAYCGRFLTDGAIPKEQVRRLADIDDPMIHAAKLVSVGLWHETADGFQVNDYLDYNPAGERVRAERSAAKERMSRHRSPEQEKCSAEVQPNKPRSSSSPSPSPSPSQSEAQEPPSAAARTRKTANTEALPAVTLFHEGFERLKGRKPAKNKVLEDRAQALFESQGEETFCRALTGFFGCLGGSDPYPKAKGFDLAVFVRQFDTWEGGASQNSLVRTGAAGQNGMTIDDRVNLTRAALEGM